MQNHDTPSDPSAREAFEVSRDGAIATVTLLGPGKGNAMGPAFWRECPLVFGELDADDDVRVVIVHGSGRHFSTGLDLMAMAGELGELITGKPGPKERAKLLAMIARMQAGPDALARCRKPVVAALHGWCIGGGLDLAAACDLRVCAADARFSLREVKVAMVADVGSLQRLPPIIGEGHTRELALTGKDIGADRALAIGLVNEVFPDDEACLAGARALAAEIADNPPLAVQGTKHVMNERLHAEIAEGLERAAMWNTAFLPSLDLAEAMAAFVEKRPARFTGE